MPSGFSETASRGQASKGITKQTRCSSSKESFRNKKSGYDDKSYAKILNATIIILQLDVTSQPTSIDSDYIQETQLDLDDDEPWRREVESIPVEQENVRIERNGRSRRSESKKEESIKSKKESVEKKQIRDVSVGAPDTKESGCQTRESLFQTDPAISSDGIYSFCL